MDESIFKFCGQSISLTANLRGIIQDYQGSQLIDELLQNADDASAKLFTILFDRRQHVYQSSSLLSPSLSAFQGPALYQYCDSSFTDEDFRSIQRIGEGLKRGDTTKTGQFGLGFNACYHITDLPSFVSGKHLVIFDPHERYLTINPHPHHLHPQSSARSRSGIQIDLQAMSGSKQQFMDLYADQIAPYGLFGFDGRGHWIDAESGRPQANGTLFRFPLRSASIAKSSDIKQVDGIATMDEIQTQVIDSFLHNIQNKLLFLRSVESIEVYIWNDGDEEMKLAGLARLEHVTAEIREQRRAMACRSHPDPSPCSFQDRLTRHYLQLQHYSAQRSQQNLIYKLSIHQIVASVESYEDYLISTVHGDEEDIAFCSSDAMRQAELLLMPYASVAACISSPISLQGKIYCTLPTRMITGLPIHVNARWELTRDRNHFTSSSMRQEYNHRLVHRIAPMAYARLIRYLLDEQQMMKMTPSIDDFYALFPSNDRAYDSLWIGLIAGFYSLLCDANHKDWRCYDPAASRSPIAFIASLRSEKALLLHDQLLLPASEVYVLPLDQQRLSDICVKLSCPLAAASSARIMEDVMLYADCKGVFTPKSCRHWIRTSSPKIQMLSIEELILLLDYCLSDLRIIMMTNSNSSADIDLIRQELSELPLLPVYNPRTSSSVLSYSYKSIYAADRLLEYDQPIVDQPELGYPCHRFIHRLASSSSKDCLKLIVKEVSTIILPYAKILNYQLFDAHVLISTILPMMLDPRINDDVLALASIPMDEQRSLLDWIDNFWTYLASCYLTIAADDVAKLRSYHLFPIRSSADTTVEVTHLRHYHPDRMIFLGDQDSAAAKEIWEIIFYQLDGKIDVLHRCSSKIQELALLHHQLVYRLSSINLLTAIYKLDQRKEIVWSRLSKSQRITLLSYLAQDLSLSADGSTDTVLMIIRSLPLYLIARHDDEDCFVRLSSSSTWFLLPTTATSSDSSMIMQQLMMMRGEMSFLAHPDVGHVHILELYSHLGIQTITLASFYISYILPPLIWQIEFNEDQRYAHLINIRALYETQLASQAIHPSIDLYPDFTAMITSDSSKIMRFGDFFPKLPLFSVSSIDHEDDWISISDMCDPRIEVVDVFYRHRYPLRFHPHPHEGSSYQSMEAYPWLSFFSYLGMRSQLSRSILLQCARYLSDCYLTITGNQQLSDSATRALDSPQLAINWKRNIMSLQTAARIISQELFRNYHHYTSTGMIDDQNEHVMMSVDQWLLEMGQQYIAEPWYPPSSSNISLLLVPYAGAILPVSMTHAQAYRIAGRSKHIVRDHHQHVPLACIRGLGAVSAPSADDAINQLVALSQHQTRTRTSAAELLTELDMIYTLLAVYIKADPSSSSTLMDRMRRGMIYSPVYDRFCDADQCFAGYNMEDIIDFAYRWDHMHVAFSMQGFWSQNLKIAAYPSIEQLTGWSKYIAKQATNHRLASEDELMRVIIIARLAYKVIAQTHTPPSSLDRLAFYLPDQRLKLHATQQRPPSIFYDDCPWLEDKIDKSELPILHPKIPIEHALALHMQPLSRYLRKEVVAVDMIDGDDSSTRKQLADSIIVQWERNIRSASFQGAIRRVLNHRRLRYQSMGHHHEEEEVDEIYRKLSQLSDLSIHMAKKIELRYCLDVWDEDADCLKMIYVANKTSSTSSSTMAALIRKHSHIIVYLLLPEANSNRGRGWEKRLLTAIAIQIDDYLNSAFIDRALISDFISCDNIDEIRDLLESWEIPVLNTIDLRLGSRVRVRLAERKQARARRSPSDGIIEVVLASDIGTEAMELGTEVYLSPAKEDDDLAAEMTGMYLTEHKEEGYRTVSMIIGKIDRIVRSGNEDDDIRYIIAISSDYMINRTCSATQLYIEDVSISIGDQSTVPKHQIDQMQELKDNALAEMIIYQPSADWITSEENLLTKLKQKYDPSNPDSIIHPSRYETEAHQVDELVYRNMSASSALKNLQEVQIDVEKRQGYDLIRVGNFAEETSMLQDIAFFHHRLSYLKEFDGRRERLLRESCRVLRMICTEVFDYDPVFVTLFYQASHPMPTSRFIRQKILLNIAPIDHHLLLMDCPPENLVFLPFAYSYFYGLLVHKLAHFFDIVHGTRHDFFMMEYRCHYMSRWIALLERQGFDSEEIVTLDYAQQHLFQITT
jgi:hypothetical protein